MPVCEAKLHTHTFTKRVYIQICCDNLGILAFYFSHTAVKFYFEVGKKHTANQPFDCPDTSDRAKDNVPLCQCVKIPLHDYN